MNERINELILKAGFHPFVRGEQILFDISTEDNLKEFAELIVRECVATLKEDMELAHIQLIPLDFKMYANGRLQRTIKDHFGVE
jgi:hypothetical protein